ncbi:hypothetical protein [Magnetospirillum aberrantis]|uniref:Uncharacterized protein n=1 Tax=Magnetospirillum aberrantis SpK TaxID=908842 RepID=A0A7C9QSK4_9PROT|nr:hypothetical protein [Magnetospirillum aberrantis]NFV79199.1 hypothetical protein [Magnetospirillum aberrantis SpK]
MGSTQTLKTLALTVATAGAFHEVGTLTDGHFTEAGKTVGGKTAGQYFASADYLKNVAGHAVVGGTASVLGGGDFASGALSGGFGAAVSPATILLNQRVPYTGLVTTVAVGGTASTLAGGTFEQGAMTAGLGYLFNNAALITLDNGYFSDHSALYVEGKEGREAVLYDPGGSYPSKGGGTGDAIYGSEADYNKYSEYWRNNGSNVTIDWLNTTESEDSLIVKNIETLGGRQPFTCALSTSACLSNVGKFNGIDSYFFPGNLRRRILDILNRK